MATVSGKTEPLSDELHLSGLKLDGSPTPAMATVFGKPEPLSDDLGLSDLKLRDKVAASPTASLIHQRRLTTSTSPASSLQMGGVGLTGTLPEKMEAASGEITSGSRLPFGSGAAIAQGVGLNSNYPVGAHTARTRPPMHFLDEDWTDSFKILFAETPAKTYPWTGHVIKPFKPFDLDAMRKCAAGLITAFPVGVEFSEEGYQIEPGMICPFKAARKLKGHHFFICRSTARRAHKHSAKIQEGGCYNSRPISHGSYGAYGFEP